jgi:hypothetical protein
MPFLMAKMTREAKYESLPGKAALIGDPAYFPAVEHPFVEISLALMTGFS